MRKGNPEDQIEHVIMQLRKNVSLEGAKAIKFADGTKQSIPAAYSERILHYYDQLKPATKVAFQQHIGTSVQVMYRWLEGEEFVHDTSSQPIDTREINNDEIFGYEQQSHSIRTVKSLAHRQMHKQKTQERRYFRERLAEIIANA